MKRHFIAGDYLTWVDFYVFEQLEVFQWLTESRFLDNYPALKEYHKRMTEIPGFKEYYNSPSFIKGPFNSKSALINNM